MIFGHPGITLAVAVLLEGTLFKKRPGASETCGVKGQFQPSNIDVSIQSSHRGITSWTVSLAKHIDIRLLLIGSILPDIVDKPIGLYFFKDTFSNGQIFGHTLLFFVVITLVGLALYLSLKKIWVLVLAFGTFTHLILDRMWQNPRTLLWPLYGSSFERYEILSFARWVQDLFQTVSTSPVLSIPELTGITIIIWFIWLLVRRKKFCVFLKNGQL